MYLFINKYLLTFLLKTRPICCFPQKTSLPFTEHVATWVSRERILCTSILFTQKLQTITICYLLSKAMIQNVWVARIWGLQKHSGKINKCLILLFLPRHSLLATAGEVILGYTFNLPFVFSVRVLNFPFPPSPENKIKEQPFLKEPTQEPTEPVASSKQAVKKDSFRHQIPMLSLENLRTSVCFCYLRSCRTELERRL